MNKKKGEEETARTAYLTKNSITATPTSTGLIYIEEKKGTGKKAEAGKMVVVQYTGTLLDGTKFDSSLDHGGQPFEFVLGQGQVIPGWDEGIAMMQEGGKAKLIIPSTIGYGGQAAGPIPPYSTLVFDVELIKVKEASSQNLQQQPILEPGK
jgi:FKBP-type peptidyl-prolyl cis-trans isomerase